ncbi:MAG: mercury resistance system periplasmic binding protein MerP [Gammaproteobacteria bacterium]|nr:MAG: mercury resistance system periplasmic binding protein MerP [Gammaproteobacteria bacterium]
MIRALLLSFTLGIAALLLFSQPAATAAEAQTVTLDVPGMTCKFCPITIRKALSNVPGVIEAQSDFETKTATVTFDPDKASLSDLTDATANAGYPSTVKTE